MVLARSVREVFDYILQEDRALPVEKQTVFHLRRFTTELAFRTQDLGGDARGKIGEIVLRAGIAGWSNFRDASGSEIECKHDKGKHLVWGATVEDPLTKDAMSWLPPEIVGELGNAIIAGNTLTEEDAKNSS